MGRKVAFPSVLLLAILSILFLLRQNSLQFESLLKGQSQLATGRVKKAWPDVPYHFYLSVDGRIAEGRDVNFVGDTNTDYNPTGHILIVLEGNFDEEQPTSAQLESLRVLVLWAASNWRIQANALRGHKDYAQTACPGKNLERELPQLQKLIADAGDSKKHVKS